MALELYIPPCLDTPAHPFHLPPIDKPLRIHIEGLLVSIQKLLPGVTWPTEEWPRPFPLPAGPELARLTYRKIYGRDVRTEVEGDMVVQDEYLGWVVEVRPLEEIDYYGVTVDHLLAPDDADPEVLQINIIEVDDDDGAYANKYLRFAVDPAEYTGKKVLAVPRCCQKRIGTTDRRRVNGCVIERRVRREKAEEAAKNGDLYKEEWHGNI